LIKFEIKKNEKTLDRIIRNKIKSKLQNLELIEDLDSIKRFAKKILNAKECLIWFKDYEKNLFWSVYNNKKIYLSEDFVLKHEDYLLNDQNREDIQYYKKTIEFEDEINNLIFYQIQHQQHKYQVFLTIINIKNKNYVQPKIDKEIFNIFSSLLIQTIDKNSIADIAKYYFEEQQKAYNKQKLIIANEFQNSNRFIIDIFYKPTDILNGDSYSIYKASNGDFLVYILDAMGHGIASSLTSYSISAIIQQKVRAVSNFKELMESILDNVQYILTDEEQLTCGFFWFKEDLSAVEYVVAGMYAPMILDGEKIVLAKANNIPFMNFAFDVSITTIELNDFKRFLIFTDGLVEDTKDLEVDLEKLIIEDNYIQDVFNKLNEIELEDDTTIIRISTK
jgi:hypothetical protein